ncbi:hypothetical protein [Cellvibrio polysaccharolyticus]|uniref:hypothetical protein n=1 Tax=Cellvibrio polysaccharolyticus TaxID=2082724 RepID=UPI00187E9B7E|nr:hypothetical protein [Cellvibrio polysaccharolyticus]
MKTKSAKAESRKQKAESRKQKAESRKQKAESRKQKAESRKQKAESRKQKSIAEITIQKRRRKNSTAVFYSVGFKAWPEDHCEFGVRLTASKPCKPWTTSRDGGS